MYYVHIYFAFVKCWFNEGKININQIMFNWTLSSINAIISMKVKFLSSNRDYGIFQLHSTCTKYHFGLLHTLI